MLFAAGIEQALLQRKVPVITAADFHRVAQDLHGARTWRGEPLKRLPRDWDQRRALEMISRLIKRGSLGVDRDFGQGVYRVLDAEVAGMAEEIACLVDPFCYVAYSSALHLHGLWPTRPSPLRLTTPEARQWRALQAQQVAATAPGEEGVAPTYPRPSMPAKLRRRAVVLHETSQPAPTLAVGLARVSVIGETFADTLAEPARCGGMVAVLKIWENHARRHVPEIVAALERAASKIVKVRAGYILTERLGVETPEIQAWQSFAQRGGSRRLDPERAYAATFSERWMLSLNVEDSG